MCQGYLVFQSSLFCWREFNLITQNESAFQGLPRWLINIRSRQHHLAWAQGEETMSYPNQELACVWACASLARDEKVFQMWRVAWGIGDLWQLSLSYRTSLRKCDPRPAAIGLTSTAKSLSPFITSSSQAVLFKTWNQSWADLKEGKVIRLTEVTFVLLNCHLQVCYLRL